jgi:hypothetical protein
MLAPGHLPTHTVLFTRRLGSKGFRPLGNLAIALEERRDEIRAGTKHARRPQHALERRYSISKALTGLPIVTKLQHGFTAVQTHDLVPRGEPFAEAGINSNGGFRQDLDDAVLAVVIGYRLWLSSGGRTQGTTSLLGQDEWFFRGR